VFVAERAGPVTSDVGSRSIAATATLAQAPRPDVVVVPGGPGQAELMTDGPVHEWLRAADYMGLTLAGRIAGDEAAQLIQLGIEYDREPPYRAGGPRS
jgi:transcriptional regulator GlxA family with amidase domain